ncbi:MAG: LysM peptidoglycan-binding domain-containing protein [Caldilineaceae bacterium]
MKTKMFAPRAIVARLLLLIMLVAIAIPAAMPKSLFANSAESPLAAPIYAVYTVRAGDTLSAIAVRTGTQVASLVAINQLSNANQIRVGQVILVPAAVENRGSTTNYTVRRGDTMYSLANTFNTTVGVLMWLNGISNANAISVGQVLQVPGSGGGGSTPTPGATRIRFPAGGTSATVTGSVRLGERPCYVFGAMAGQTATLQITSPGNVANFDFAPTDLAVNGGVPFKRIVNEDRTFSQLLPVTGDYIACVQTPGSAVTYSLTVTIPPLSGACSSPSTAIRSTDWNNLMSTDPALQHQVIGGKQYVTVVGGTTAGFPVVSSVVYGDFDGNCAEEAALPLESGGTAGMVGYLVYRAGTPKPHLIAWGDGYKLSLSVSSNRLIVTNALYVGWEANCCPSGFSHSTYRLAGDVLTLVNTTTEGLNGMQAPTVEQFYTYLNNRDFTNAYAMLSPTFQAANPFASWKAGYNNTVSFTVNVSADPGAANRVQVTINAVESTSGGGTVNHTYVGYWDTMWGGNGWLLNRGVFHVG